LAFPVIGFFHWSITPTKEAIKPLSTPKTDTSIVVLLSFWATYVGSRGEFFGQRIWDKVCDAIENTLGTYWELEEQLRS
jgi:hypothetical protein